MESRTTQSPLALLKDVDLSGEFEALAKRLQRDPTGEEFVMYLNHPGDALKTIEFRTLYGDPNRLPLDVWFEGLEPGQELFFEDTNGKPHTATLLDISAPDHQGMSVVRYVLDSEILSHQVKVAEAVSGRAAQAVEMADPANPYHIAAPCNGDLWVMHVSPGDFLKPGQEVFNISVMKQEKSMLSQVEGVVKRVLKSADYFEDKKMVPVKEGELLVELTPVGKTCPGCKEPLTAEDFHFCPWCGYGVELVD
jgi:pyruvate carboxylase